MAMRSAGLRASISLVFIERTGFSQKIFAVICLKVEEQIILTVDIGGTHVRIGAANRKGAIGERKKLSTDILRVENPLHVLINLINDYIALLPARPAQIVVGVPGFMDESRRMLIKAPNIDNLCNVNLADSLAQACKMPVWLEHDVTLRIRGEHALGSAEGANFVLGIFFGTGIGAAFLKNGKPLRGGPYSMELGHIHIRDEGALCGCGGKDCAEAYASGRVLARIAKGFDIPVENVFTRRHEKPELARMLARFLEDQAITIAIATVLFDPQIILLGGGVIEMKDYPYNELSEIVRKRLPPIHETSRHKFTLARSGWNAVLHGAIAVVDEKAELAAHNL
jgi:allose kinase